VYYEFSFSSDFGPSGVHGFLWFYRHLTSSYTLLFYVAVRLKMGDGLLVLVFLDRTQRRISVYSFLDEKSTRRRYLYRTKHNTQKRQTTLRPVGFEPTNWLREPLHTHKLDSAAPEFGYMLNNEI